MKILEGSPISPGFASGIAIVYDYEVERKLTLPDRVIRRADVPSECARIDEALEQSKSELQFAEQTASGDPKLADTAALLSAHASMASEIAASVKQQIGCDLVNVEQALDSVIRDWINRLQKLDDEYLRHREQDVRDVGQRMTRNLAGVMPCNFESLPSGSVIVARELLPSEAVGLASSGVVAIVSEFGGKFSHTAIVARSLGIPAISGVANVTKRIPSGAKLLVDGLSGAVTIQPSDSEEAEFAVRQIELPARYTRSPTRLHFGRKPHHMTDLTKKRPEFRNINAFKELTPYRLPPAGYRRRAARDSAAHRRRFAPPCAPPGWAVGSARSSRPASTPSKA